MRTRFIIYLIRLLLPGYHLARNPPKGALRINKKAFLASSAQEADVGTVEERIEAGKGLSLAYPEKGE